jgi:exosome complex component RRP43
MASVTTQPTLSFPRETFAKLSPHPYLLAHLQSSDPKLPSRRANGREPAQFRDPHVNNGSLTHAEGSAVVRIGDTTVVCGVRGEIVLASNVAGYRVDKSSTAPSSSPGYNEAKELDLLVPNIELATGCSPAFMPGQPPSTLAQGLSTSVYSLLHSSRLVDNEGLRIWYQPPNLGEQDMIDDDEDVPEPEIKAFWTLYIDVLFISLDGNPFDAAWAAVVSALGDVRLPKAYWDADREMILCDDSVSESKKLMLRGMPIAVTSLVFTAKEQGQGKDKTHWILADPDAFEEGLCSEAVRVVLDCQNGKTALMGISKSGGTTVGRDDMGAIVALAEMRWNQLKRLFAR